MTADFGGNKANVVEGHKSAQTAGSARTARIKETVRNVLAQRSARVGLFLLGILVFVATFAPLIAPYGPLDNLNGPGEPGRRAEPCIHAFYELPVLGAWGCPETQPETYLGTDGNSRDIFSRVVYGARISLPIGPAVVGLAIIVGAIVGAIAGFASGWTDMTLMRIMDIVLSFPALILAIAIVTLIGSGLLNAVAAVIIVSIPLYARLTRSAVLSTREHDYVTASRALGESSTGILRRRVLPNSITPLIVAGSLGIATAVLEVAALSFLGLGIAEPTPEWGAMIGRDFNSIFSRPLLVLSPAFMLTVMVLGFNLLGDGIRDALDPRLNR
jgi:ABC-type dipeptide/oligopeptide/nickel transport system permease subunit